MSRIRFKNCYSSFDEKELVEILTFFLWSDKKTNNEERISCYSLNPKCPYCKKTGRLIYKKRKLFLYECQKCSGRRQFHIFTRTPLSHKRSGLWKWFTADDYIRQGGKPEEFPYNFPLSLRDRRKMKDNIAEFNRKHRTHVFLEALKFYSVYHNEHKPEIFEKHRAFFERHLYE